MNTAAVVHAPGRTGPSGKADIKEVRGLVRDSVQIQHVPGDIPVPADYDGDGRAEMAVFRPSTGEWIIDKMKQPVKFGQTGDIPVPGNYYKDGKAYPAVYRSNKLILQSGKEIDLAGGRKETLVNLPYALRKSLF